MKLSTIHSAQLSADWDWSNSNLSYKKTKAQEAFKYDPRRLAQVGGDEEAYPFDVVDTKLRIRGAGRTLKVRYESTEGKDFILLGHAVKGIDRGDTEGNK